MSPHRDRGQGTLVIDRQLRGVGRIKRASGTMNATVFRRINRALTALVDDGRLDLLRALRDGTITPLALLDAKERNALDQLPTAEGIRLLPAAWLAWVLAKDCSMAHKRSLVQSLRHLLAKPVPSPFGAASLAAVTKKLPRKTVGDLPALLLAARLRLATHPRSFNIARAACQAFLRETLKRSHPLWVAVTDVEPLAVRAVRAKRPQTVAGLLAICQVTDDATTAALWAMATTGMGPGEYWGAWERTANGIAIHGTKREGRDRTVPDVGQCQPPALSRQAFEDRLIEQTGAALTPYDLRRTYANWLEAAGIIRARRRMYLGHGAHDVSDLYEWHDVLQFLAADAKTLRRWLERERKAAERGPALVSERHA